MIKNLIKNNEFKYFSKITIFIISSITAAVISLIVSKYFLADDIQLNAEYINTGADKYMYLFEITNKKSTIEKEIVLEVFLNQDSLISSLFESYPTTHEKENLEKIYNLKGEITVKSDSEDKIINFNEVEYEKGILYKPPKNALSNCFWYKVSINNFSLAGYEKKTASILLNKKIEKDSIRCVTEKSIFKPKKINELKIDLNSVLSLLSSENYQNKVFVEGFGFSKNSNIYQTRVIAKDRALRSLYTEISKKMYGLKINSTSLLSSSKGETTYDISTIYTTEGKIDLNSIVIYSENYNNDAEDNTWCELKAYYKIPWKANKYFEYSDSGVGKYKNVLIKTGFPRPDWIDNSSKPGAVTAIGIASLNKYPLAVAKQLCVFRANDEIASQLGIVVNNVTLIDENHENYESFSFQTYEQILKDIKIIECYISDSNDLFIFAEYPASKRNELETYIKNNKEKYYESEKALWKKFQAKKGHEDLEKEIEKEFGDL